MVLVVGFMVYQFMFRISGLVLDNFLDIES
jgi:hypothetical protein